MALETIKKKTFTRSTILGLLTTNNIFLWNGSAAEFMIYDCKDERSQRTDFVHAPEVQSCILILNKDKIEQ